MKFIEFFKINSIFIMCLAFIMLVCYVCIYKQFNIK